jgi:putative RNase toxin 16 of polymorphic toxin system
MQATARIQSAREYPDRLTPQAKAPARLAHRPATIAPPVAARARTSHPRSPAGVIQLHRWIGNRRTTEFIGEARIQRKENGDAGHDSGSQSTRVEAGPAPPAPPAPSTPPSAPPPAAPNSPAALPSTEGSALSRTEEAAGGGGQPPSGKVDLGSSDAILQSLATAAPSELGPALAKAQAAKADVQVREKTALEASFPTVEKPTGLPPRQRPAMRQGKTSRGEAPELESGAEQQAEKYETAAEVAEGPLPASGAPAAIAEEATEDEGGWWDWLINRIRGFLNRIPTTDAGLSTSAGERPRVALSGAADPSRMGQHEQESAATVGQKQREADQATTADFGENKIAPNVHPEMLRPQYRPAAPEASGGRGRHAPISDAFDHIVGPSMGEQIQAENQKYGEAKSQHQTESAQLREESSRRIAEENSRTRSEQLAMRQQAREQVDVARQEWRATNQRAAQSFNDGAQAKRKEAETQIDTKVADAERQADAELTKAETESQKEKIEAEKKAAEEKRKAEEKPRSWWDRFKGAVSSAFSAIRDAVNGIFEAVRAKVRQLIQAAKRFVRGLIEAARSAIVGLIRAFGEALKGLVSIALAAFPEAAERARRWIDDRVESAVESVNQAAEALKQAADAALDWLGEQLDKLLAKLQAAFDSILAVIATIVDLLLNLDEIWARIVAKLREAAPVPSDVAGVLRFFEELRDSIQGPAAAPQSPATAASDVGQAAGTCAECEEEETLQRTPSPSTIQRELKPPGNCEQGIHDAMQRLVKAWCDPPHWWGSRGDWRHCTAGDRCNMLLEKIRRNQLCAQHRFNINRDCYDGGNEGHKIAERDARYAQANCMALYRAKCQPVPVPPPVPVPKEETESAWERFKRFMREYQKELAIGVLAACVVALVLLLVPEPVVTKILAGLSALTAAVAFIALYVKFKNWDNGNTQA